MGSFPTPDTESPEDHAYVRMPIPRTLNHDFFKTWTPEMAYILGYFAADGSMLKNRRGAHFIEFVSTDEILIRHVQRVCGSSHRISKRVRKGTNEKEAYRLQIGSKEWFKDLSGLGFTQAKSHTLHFPNVPTFFLGDFVRGYFDGDGCAYFKQHWSKSHGREVWVFATLFTSGSKDFLTSLKGSVSEYGVIGGHIHPKQKGGFDLVFSRHDSLALYRLMYDTAEVGNLYLPRKREKLEQAIRILNLGKPMQS